MEGYIIRKNQRCFGILQKLVLQDDVKFRACILYIMRLLEFLPQLLEQQKKVIWIIFEENACCFELWKVGDHMKMFPSKGEIS